MEIINRQFLRILLRAAALGRLLIFSTKPVLVVRGVWGGIIDVTMELADVENLADGDKKGKEFFGCLGLVWPRKGEILVIG